MQKPFLKFVTVKVIWWYFSRIGIEPESLAWRSGGPQIGQIQRRHIPLQNTHLLILIPSKNRSPMSKTLLIHCSVQRMFRSAIKQRGQRKGPLYSCTKSCGISEYQPPTLHVTGKRHLLNAEGWLYYHSDKQTAIHWYSEACSLPLPLGELAPHEHVPSYDDPFAH